MSSAWTGNQSARQRSPSPAHVERLDSTVDAGQQRVALTSPRRGQRRLGAGVQLESEDGVVAEQKPPRALRFAEAPDGLAEARRGEVEEREPLEQLEVGHGA
jgi:hypothetical protein